MTLFWFPNFQSYTPQIAHKVAVCPRGNLLYIRIYLINNTNIFGDIEGALWFFLLFILIEKSLLRCGVHSSSSPGFLVFHSSRIKQHTQNTLEITLSESQTHFAKSRCSRRTEIQTNYCFHRAAKTPSIRGSLPIEDNQGRHGHDGDPVHYSARVKIHGDWSSPEVLALWFR